MRKFLEKLRPGNNLFRFAAIVTIGMVIVLLLVESAKVRLIERSLIGYMDNLKDLIFLSTYDSLKKGNMKTFTSHLEDIGQYRDVREFSLLNPAGEVRYSSDPSHRGTRDPRVVGITTQTMVDDGDDIVYYFPVVTVGYCVRCHPTWKHDTVNSYYKAVLSQQALNTMRTFSRYYIVFLVGGGALFIWFIHLVFDRMERRRMEQQLLLSASVFDNTIEAIAVTDPQGVIGKINSAFTMMTGYAAAEAIGHSIGLLNPDGDKALLTDEARAILNSQGTWSGEFWLRRGSGESFPVWLSVSAVKTRQGEISHHVCLFHDMTEVKRSEDVLRHQVYHDALTGLPNRRLFSDRLEMALSYAQRSEQPLAVMFIDLDDFKTVNDRYGHQVGDHLLQGVATRLQECCRDGDTVARLGGDEFVMILPAVAGREDAVAIAQRIREVLAAPLTVSGVAAPLSVKASLGFTLSPRDGRDAHTLLGNADLAMYRAKSAGKDTCLDFGEVLNR